MKRWVGCHVEEYVLSLSLQDGTHNTPANAGRSIAGGDATSAFRLVVVQAVQNHHTLACPSTSMLFWKTRSRDRNVDCELALRRCAAKAQGTKKKPMKSRGGPSQPQNLLAQGAAEAEQ